MEKIWLGVDHFLDEYVRVRDDDRVVLAYTPDSRDQAAWILTALRVRGVAAQGVVMAPLEDPGFAERLKAVLPPAGSYSERLVIITAEANTMSHTGVFRSILGKYARDTWIAVRIISASPEFFTHSMGVGREELSRLNSALLHKLIDAREIRVTTEAGTDLAIRMDPDRYRWLSNRGKYRPGGFMVMPPGEVATFPAQVDGVLVADGAFNINVFTQLDARLADSPAVVEIEDGRAVRHSSADSRVDDLLKLIFATENATRIGELGFGTNNGIGEFIPMNCHINERRPGLHVGFGQHNQSVFEVDYECAIHMDLICNGGQVHIGDDVIDLARLEPTDEPHPVLVMDEDIDGDCCGLWMDDLRAGLAVPRSAPRSEEIFCVPRTAEQARTIYEARQRAQQATEALQAGEA